MSTANRRHVMIDIDEPLFPWAHTIHEACREAGLHDLPTWKTWHMWEDYGCEKDAWLEVVARLTADGMYLTAPAVVGAAEAVRRLYWEGHHIHLVTARGFMEHADDIRRWTPEWLAASGVPYETLTFSQNKPAVQEELGVRFDFAIDDGIHNYQALDNAGVQVYLLDQPHNAEFPAERRVFTMSEFADIVTKEVSRG